MCQPIAHRNLVDWLRTQKQVIAHWHDTVSAIPSADIDLVRSLDIHHNWLAQELIRLTNHLDQKVPR